MSASTARVSAVIRKELAELRRNRLIVVTAAMLPVIFLVGPTAEILTLKASAPSATLDKRVDYALFLPLMVSVLVPAVMSAYSVVGEREQGTLEPVLTTPVSRTELLIGKAAAVFMPALVLGYLIFGVFVAVTQLAAASPVAAAVRHAPQLPAALVFIPLLSAWAIWAGLAISTRVSDTRVAQQLAVLGSLPPVAVAALMSFQVITPTFALAAALAGGLLAVDCAACLAVARLFDRERLITGARPGRGTTVLAAPHDSPRRSDGSPERKIKVSATLKVTQESLLNPAGILRGTFDVVVDGKSVGSIKWHEAIEVPVEPGHHTLQVRTGRYSSRVKAFDAAEEEFVAFRCNRRRHPLILVAALAAPSLAISLARE
jgi:ABC-2 type transport system permease protein